MKLLQGMLILLLGMTIPAHASDQKVLLAKIDTAFKNDRTSEALSYCTTLEKMGPSLAKPLPESFYYDCIETLHRSGGTESVLKRAYAYLEMFDKDASHYRQVTAIVKELQMKAVRAEKGGTDAAVLAWEEADRLRREKEHAQTLQKLRACQGEAMALEAMEKELNVEYEEINAQSDSLHAKKASLDKRKSRIDRSSKGTLEEQKQVLVDFNADSQAYNDALVDFNGVREIYAAKVDGQSSQLQLYKDRCVDLLVVKSDMEAVCGESDDWFCRSLK